MEYSKVILLGGEHNGLYMDVPTWLYMLSLYVIKGFGVTESPTYRIETYEKTDEKTFWYKGE